MLIFPMYNLLKQNATIIAEIDIVFKGFGKKIREEILRPAGSTVMT